MTTQEMANVIGQFANFEIPKLMRNSDAVFVKTADPRALQGGARNWEVEELREAQEMLRQVRDFLEGL